MKNLFDLIYQLIWDKTNKKKQEVNRLRWQTAMLKGKIDRAKERDNQHG